MKKNQSYLRGYIVISRQSPTMAEHFAGDCSSICSSPNLSSDMQAVCDTGSQQYCSVGSNVFTPNCKSYLTRVTGSAAADRLGKVYANPIRFQKVPAGQTAPTINDYYNQFQSAVTRVVQSLPADGIANNDIRDIVNIIKTNNSNYASDPMYVSLFSRAINYCISAPMVDANFCSESSATPSWVASEFAKYFADMATMIKSDPAMTGSLVAKYSKNATSTPTKIAADLVAAQLAHQRLPKSLQPLDDLILNSLTKDDLLDPNLVLLRAVSPYLQTGVDTFVINLINGPKSGFTRERLSANPSMYSVVLNNTAELYGTNVRTFLANLQSYAATNKITSDPMLTLVQMTDNANITTCSTGNPLTNPICAQVASATGAVNAATIANATIAFCSDAKNVNSSACIAHINSNQKVYNMNDVNTKMLNYCLTTGQNDAVCKPFSTITGSSQWLVNATKNSTDAKGVITSVCGTPGNLSKATCQSVCNVYPSLCEADIQQKCAIADNRYSTNTDFFAEKESFDPKSSDPMTIIIWIIIAIMAALGVTGTVMAIGNSDRYQRWRYGSQYAEDHMIGSIE